MQKSLECGFGQRNYILKSTDVMNFIFAIGVEPMKEY